MVFDYSAKSGKRRIQGVVDPLALDIVCSLKTRRGGGPELLAYKNGRQWCDLRSDDINDYLKEKTGGDFSAKDFRTWSATVIAALALAVSGPAHGAKTSRKRAITRAIKETAHYLGNTPAVCRASYIDPRVFDAYRGGLVLDRDVIDDALAAEPGTLPTHHPRIERAVLDLIDEREHAPGVENARRLACGRRAAGCGGSSGGGVSRSGVGSAGTIGSSGTAGVAGSGGRDRRGRLGRLRDFEHVAVICSPAFRIRRRRASRARSG